MINKENIAIILCTYNGEDYLSEQLDSIISQTYKNWTLYISDDGSTDGTIEIIKRYQKKIGDDRLFFLTGPKRGFAWNFIHTLQKIRVDYDFFAFCDQDDIWCDEKLERAINSINDNNINPVKDYALYGSRTKIIDAFGHEIGLSNLFKRKLGLQNSLVQSFAGGNTMLFTRALKNPLNSLPVSMEIVSHDWLLYILCSLLNGKIIYDSNAYIFYRQHGNNIVGDNLGVLKKLNRLKKIYQGDLKRWNKINEVNILHYSSMIKEEHKKTIKLYYYNSDLSPVGRFLSFKRSGVYRQSALESIFFLILSLLGKLR